MGCKDIDELIRKLSTPPPPPLGIPLPRDASLNATQKEPDDTPE